MIIECFNIGYRKFLSIGHLAEKNINYARKERQNYAVLYRLYKCKKEKKYYKKNEQNNKLSSSRYRTNIASWKYLLDVLLV